MDKFLGVYRRYAAETLRARAQETLSAATAVTDATNLAVQRAGELVALQEESERRAAAVQQLTEERDEIVAALRAIEKREIFKTADDLVQRDRTVAEASPLGGPVAGRGRAGPGPPRAGGPGCRARARRTAYRDQ